jgi:predicted outer membrane repeat protein
MAFTRWLSNHLGLSPRPVSQRKSTAARPRFRPALEALEHRWVPSTLTVTNNQDSGEGSLRAQIAAAHNGDTINFASSLTGKTIALSTGELYINHKMSITGLGAANLTISGGTKSHVFEVDKTANQVALSGLTIRDAYSAYNSDQTVDGGAILNHGVLTISNCILSNNTGGDGGAIENDDTLTVSGCTLINNKASDTAGAINSIHTGTLTVRDSTFSYNTAGNGGAIGTDGPATISGCTITYNSAGYYGGGIASDGPISITNCTLSNNTAKVSGGGIYCTTNAYYYSFTATVTGTTLSNNSAVNGGAIYTGSPGMTLKLDGNCKLTGNTATYGGGI